MRRSWRSAAARHDACEMPHLNREKKKRSISSSHAPVRRVALDDDTKPDDRRDTGIIRPGEFELSI